MDSDQDDQVVSAARRRRDWNNDLPCGIVGAARMMVGAAHGVRRGPPADALGPSAAHGRMGLGRHGDRYHGGLFALMDLKHLLQHGDYDPTLPQRLDALVKQILAEREVDASSKDESAPLSQKEV
jgi:hypothetical protein